MGHPPAAVELLLPVDPLHPRVDRLPMAWRVASADAPRTFQAQVAMWSRAAALSREAPCDVLVIDAMRGAPALHEAMALVDDIIVPRWGRGRLAWVLLHPATPSRFLAAEIWTRAKGVNGRAFLDVATAMEWLETAAAA